MATDLEILDATKSLFRALPLHIGTDDWEKAKEYYVHEIQKIRVQLREYEDKVEEIEKRVTTVKADVVALENA